MKINDVAKLTGVTVRTLHYYDQIGLLKPRKTTKASYRIYDLEEIQTLQEILFFRELDFPLSEIKEIMENPAYDKSEIFIKHKELLFKKRNRLDGLIALVEKIIKGEKTMSFKEFDTTDIDEIKNQYAAEVKERWGKTEAYQEYTGKTSSFNNKQWKALSEDGKLILKAFADHKNSAPDSEIVQSLVEKWKDYITTNFYTCTNEILSGLGKMYVEDERFKENINKNGDGTAEFIAKAIEIYCNK